MDHIREHGKLAPTKDEIIKVIEKPDRIVAGADGELLAIVASERGWHIVVAYREGNDGSDCQGFVITAWKTTKMNDLNQREQIWP
jgi:hypothetical protein